MIIFYFVAWALPINWGNIISEKKSFKLIEYARTFECTCLDKTDNMRRLIEKPIHAAFPWQTNTNNELSICLCFHRMGTHVNCISKAHCQWHISIFQSSYGNSILVICKTGQTTTWDFSHCWGNYDYHSMYLRLSIGRSFSFDVTFQTNLHHIHIYININIELWAMTMHVFKL